MHPREGRTGRGADSLFAPSRRDFLRQGAASALLAGSAGSLLASCSTGSTSGQVTGTQTLPLPRPNNPVTWPIFAGNKAIKAGLAPERNATLKVYNWTAYINQAVVNSFAKKYNCKVEVSTFNTMDEALAKIHSGKVQFDVFMGVTIDVLGPLVEQQFIQPINHSYIPNITQAWPDFQNPFYDRKWQYTTPYTIYTTGIAWRKDKVPEDPYKMANPWAMPWQPKYKGKVAILDDYREAISLGLMKNGIFDLNTTSPSQIAAAGHALQNLAQLTNVQINNNDYTQIPAGQVWIHHAWSGDIAAAQSYLPKGTPVDVVGYWFPNDGKGPVGNDLITVLKSATNPVLAHLFMNYLLDLPNVMTNIGWNGYMQPLNQVTPQSLVQAQILPPSLMSTVVLPSYFRRGVMELQIPVSANLLWEQAWQAASKGV
jgi:spermidine/putrescine transport system substrate-binding protein